MKSVNQLIDFLYTAEVPFAEEGSVQENVDERERLVGGDETSRERDDVGIVVLTSELGDFAAPAEGAPDVGILVDCHLHAVARAADDDAPAVVATVDGGSDLMCKIWIINTFGGVGAEVFDVEAGSL